jgi:hypothetical protein
MVSLHEIGGGRDAIRPYAAVASSPCRFMPRYRLIVAEISCLTVRCRSSMGIIRRAGKQLLQRPVNAHGHRLSEPEVLVGGPPGAESGGRPAAGRAPDRGASANVCRANGCSAAANGCGKRRSGRLLDAWRDRFLAQSNDKVTISAKIACVAASASESNRPTTVSQIFILSGCDQARSVVSAGEPILTDWQDDAYAIHG